MAKPARGSSENLFSISAASDALKRSRRTITKALASVKPAAVRSGLKLWRMADIIDAVNRNTQVPILTTARQGNEVLSGIAAETFFAFERYDAAMKAMESLPTLAERRKAAHALEPIVREALDLMRQRDVDAGLHPEHVELKNDRVLLLMVRGLEGACEWTSGEAWACLDPGEDDAAA